MAPQAQGMLSLIRGERAMNLTQLADYIRANRDLCHIVTETACEEFGCLWLSVEDAVVLLGGKRLSALLLDPNRRAPSAARSRRRLHGKSIAPVANLRQLETVQGEPK
jgi:hypothetical protein